MKTSKISGVKQTRIIDLSKTHRHLTLCGILPGILLVKDKIIKQFDLIPTVKADIGPMSGYTQMHMVMEEKAMSSLLQKVT